jgi:hypothetical protein
MLDWTGGQIADDDSADDIRDVELEQGYEWWWPRRSS